MISVKTAPTIIDEEHQHHPQYAHPADNWDWYCGPNKTTGGSSTTTMSAVPEVGESNSSSSSSRSEARSAFITEEQHDVPEFASDKRWEPFDDHTFSTVDESESTTFCDNRDEEEVKHNDTYYSATTSIRFSSIVAIHSVSSLSTYTKKERNSCWYSDAAIEKSTERRNKILARIEAGKPATSKQTYRGLETHTKQGTDDVSEHINRMIAAVINEEDRQWSIGINDEDRISRISQQISKTKVAEALQAAKQDDDDATAIHFDSLVDDESCSCFTEDDLMSLAPSLAESCNTTSITTEETEPEERKPAKTNTRRGRRREQLPGRKFATKEMGWSGLFLRKYLVCN
jgi:hypothetical protein